ncbi:unnamed protein product [Heterobilharzia americana]|nr:unnamed protein product [Heterobilharzia americana]
MLKGMISDSKRFFSFFFEDVCAYRLTRTQISQNRDSLMRFFTKYLNSCGAISACQNYIETNPHVICIDPPRSIRRILTRFDQFCILRSLLEKSEIRNRVLVPNFCLLSRNDPAELHEADICYPIGK